MLLLLTIATVVLQVFSDQSDSMNSRGFQQMDNTSMINKMKQEKRFHDLHENSTMSLTPDFLSSMDRLSKALNSMERNQVPNHQKMRKERNLNLKVSHSYPVIKYTAEQQRKKRHKHNRIHLTKRFQAKPTTEKNIHAEPKCDANSTAMNTTKLAPKNKTNERGNKENEEYERLNSEMDDRDEDEEDYEDDDDYESEDDDNDEGAWGDHERCSPIKNPEQTEQKLNLTESKFNEIEKIINETTKLKGKPGLDSRSDIIGPKSLVRNMTENLTELKLSLDKKSEISDKKTEEKGGKIDEQLNKKIAKSKNKVKEMSLENRFNGIRSSKQSKARTANESVVIKESESLNKTGVSVTTIGTDCVSFSTVSVKNSEERVLEDREERLHPEKKSDADTPTEKNLVAEDKEPKIGSGEATTDSCDEEEERSSKSEVRKDLLIKKAQFENKGNRGATEKKILSGDGTEKNITTICESEKSLEPLKKINKGDNKDRSYFKRVDQLFRFREKIGCKDASNETKRLFSNIFEKSNREGKATSDQDNNDESSSNGSETTSMKFPEGFSVKDSDLKTDSKQLRESGTKEDGKKSTKPETQISYELGSEINKNFDKLGNNFHDCNKQSTTNEAVTETAICIFTNAQVSPVTVLQHDDICGKYNDWKSKEDSQQTNKEEITLKSKQELKKHFRINSLMRFPPCQNTSPVAATKETDSRSEATVTAIQYSGTSSKIPRERKVLSTTKINGTCNPEDKLELLREKILGPLIEGNSERKHTRPCTKKCTKTAEVDTPIKTTCTTSTETTKECTTKTTSNCMTTRASILGNKTDCTVLSFLSKQKTTVNTTKLEKNICRSVDDKTSKYNMATTVENDKRKSKFDNSSKNICRGYETEWSRVTASTAASESSAIQKLDQKSDFLTFQNLDSSRASELSPTRINQNKEHTVNTLNVSELSLSERSPEITNQETTENAAKMNIKEKGEIKKPLQLYLNMLNSFARKSVKAENKRRKTSEEQEKQVDPTVVSEEESHENVALSSPLSYENSLEDSAKKLVQVYVSQANQPTMVPIHTRTSHTELESKANYLVNHEGHNDNDDFEDKAENNKKLLSTSQETNLLDLMFDTSSVKPKRPFPLNIFRHKFFKKGFKKRMKVSDNETTESTTNEELLGVEGLAQENDKENKSRKMDEPGKMTKTTVASLPTSSESEIKALLGALNIAKEVETENTLRASDASQKMRDTTMLIPQGHSRNSQQLNLLAKTSRDKILKPKEGDKYSMKQKLSQEEILKDTQTSRFSSGQRKNVGKIKEDKMEGEESMTRPKPNFERFSDRIWNLYKRKSNLESGGKKTEEYCETAEENSDHHRHKSHSKSSVRNFPQLAMKNLNNYKTMLQNDVRKMYSRRKQSNTTLDQNPQVDGADVDLNHSRDRRKQRKERGKRNKKKKTGRLNRDENESRTFSDVDPKNGHSMNLMQSKQKKRRSLHFKSKFKNRNCDQDDKQGKRFRRDFPMLLHNSNSRIESPGNRSSCKNGEIKGNLYGVKNNENQLFDTGEISEHNKEEQSVVKKNDLVSTDNNKFLNSSFCWSPTRKWFEQSDLYTSRKQCIFQTILNLHHDTIPTSDQLNYKTKDYKNLNDSFNKVSNESARILSQVINDKEQDSTELYASTQNCGQKTIQKHYGQSLTPLNSNKATTEASDQKNLTPQFITRNFKKDRQGTDSSSFFIVSENNLQRFFFEPTAPVDGGWEPTMELLKINATRGEIPCQTTSINVSRENRSTSVNPRQSEQKYNNITLISIKQKNLYSINMPAVKAEEKFGQADKFFEGGNRKIILDLKNIETVPGNIEPIKICVEVTTPKDQSTGMMDLRGNLYIDSDDDSGNPIKIKSGKKNLKTEVFHRLIDGRENNFPETLRERINDLNKQEYGMKEELRKSDANCFIQPIRIKSKEEKKTLTKLNGYERIDFPSLINQTRIGRTEPSSTSQNTENFNYLGSAVQSFQRMEKYNGPQNLALQNGFGNHRDELKENSRGDSKGYYKENYNPGDPLLFMNLTTMKFEEDKIPFEMSWESLKNTRKRIEPKTTKISYMLNTKAGVTQSKLEQPTTKFGYLQTTQQNSIERQQPYRSTSITAMFTRRRHDALDQRVPSQVINNFKLPGELDEKRRNENIENKGQYPTKIRFLVPSSPLHQTVSPVMSTTRINNFKDYTIKAEPSYNGHKYIYSPLHDNETSLQDTETLGWTKAWKQSWRTEQNIKAEKQQAPNNRLTEGTVTDIGEKIRQQMNSWKQNQNTAIERHLNFDNTLKQRFITDAGEYDAASVLITPSEQSIRGNTSSSLEATTSANMYKAAPAKEESDQESVKHSGEEDEIQAATQKTEASVMNSEQKFYEQALRGITERNLMTGKLPEYNHRKIYVFEIPTKVTPESKGQLYRVKGEPIVATVTKTGVEIDGPFKSKIGQLTGRKELIDSQGLDMEKNETEAKTITDSTKTVSPVIMATIMPHRKATMKKELTNYNSLQSIKTENTTRQDKIESTVNTTLVESLVEDTSAESSRNDCLLDALADHDTTAVTDSSNARETLMETISTLTDSSTLQRKLNDSSVSSHPFSGRVTKKCETFLINHDSFIKTTRKKNNDIITRAAAKNLDAQTGKLGVDTEKDLEGKGFESKLTRWNGKNMEDALKYGLGVQDGVLNRERNSYSMSALSRTSTNQASEYRTMLMARKASNQVEGIDRKCSKIYSKNLLDKNWIWSTTAPAVSSLSFGGPFEFQDMTILDTKEEAPTVRSKSKSNLQQYDGGSSETPRYAMELTITEKGAVKIKSDTPIHHFETNELSKNENILPLLHNFSKTSIQKVNPIITPIVLTQITNAPLKSQSGTRRNHVIPRPVQFLCDNPKNYFPVLPIIQDSVHSSTANYSTTTSSVESRFSEMNSDPSIAPHRKNIKYNLKDSSFTQAFQNQSSQSFLLSQPVVRPNHGTIGSIQSHSDCFRVGKQWKMGSRIEKNATINLDTCYSQSLTYTMPSNKRTLKIKESKIANDLDMKALGKMDQIEGRKLKTDLRNHTESTENSIDDSQMRKDNTIKGNLPVFLTPHIVANSLQTKPILNNKRISLIENFNDSIKTFSYPRTRNNSSSEIERDPKETLRFKDKTTRKEKNRMSLNEPSKVPPFSETQTPTVNLPKKQPAQKFFLPSSKPRSDFEASIEPSSPSLDDEILNGQLAIKIVDDVFSKVQKSKQLSSEFGCCKNNLTKVKEEVLPFLTPVEAKIQADVIKDMVSMINLYLIKQPKAACMVLPPELKLFLNDLIADDQSPLEAGGHSEKTAQATNFDLNNAHSKKFTETRVEEQGVSKNHKHINRPKVFSKINSKSLTQKKIQCHNFDGKRAKSLGTTDEKRSKDVINNHTEIKKYRVFCKSHSHSPAQSQEYPRCTKKSLGGRNRMRTEINRKSRGWRLKTKEHENQRILLHEGPKQKKENERHYGEIRKAANSTIHRTNRKNYDLSLDVGNNFNLNLGNLEDRQDSARVVTGNSPNTDSIKLDKGVNNQRPETGAYTSSNFQLNTENEKKDAEKLREELSPNAKLLTSLKNNLHWNLEHRLDYGEEQDAQKMLVYTPTDHLQTSDFQRENFHIMKPIHQCSVTNFGSDFEERDFLTARADVADNLKFEEDTTKNYQ